jgi:hypothetical protein
MDPDPKVWLGDDGILRIEYPENFHLTLDAMHYANQRHREISTEKRPVLVYADSVASADYDAQQFASSDAAIELTRCLAIIVKSVFTRAMADLFMRFHKPPYPTRIFTREQDAMDWLDSFLHERRAESRRD